MAFPLSNYGKESQGSQFGSFSGILHTVFPPAHLWVVEALSLTCFLLDLGKFLRFTANLVGGILMWSL